MGGAFLDPFSWDKAGDCSSTPKALYYPTAVVGCLSMVSPLPDQRLLEGVERGREAVALNSASSFPAFGLIVPTRSNLLLLLPRLRKRRPRPLRAKTQTNSPGLALTRSGAKAHGEKQHGRHRAARGTKIAN